MAPTSSWNNCEGDLIFSSRFAALTAARSAEHMAELAPEHPALIPVLSPATEHSVVPVKLLLIAVRTADTTVPML